MRICHFSLCILLYSVALLPAQLTFIPLRLSGPGAQEHTALNSERFGRKPYTIEQLQLLATIKYDWDIFDPNKPIKRWRLMEKGIRNGLHPDDICEEFLANRLVCSPRGDPHETALENVEFLLKHNANPNGTTKEGRTIISCAPTYAVARYLLDNKAQPCLVNKTNNYTLLHNIVNCDYNTPESAVSLIPLFCKVGVNPNECTVDGLSPLALLAQNAEYFNNDRARTLLADTLIKVGAEDDEQFQYECTKTKRDRPHLAHAIDTIQKAVHNAQKEVAMVKERLQNSRHPAIVTMLHDLKLFGPATIVADYELDPHEYFIDEILTDADAELQRKRKEREKPRCVVQ